MAGWAGYNHARLWRLGSGDIYTHAAPGAVRQFWSSLDAPTAESTRQGEVLARPSTLVEHDPRSY